MEQVLDFLYEVSQNNNKPWFDAHKSLYLSARDTFNDFAVKLIDGIAAFDPTVKGLGIKQCTYRFYRDLRFSKDKSPYKTHFGVFVAPGGKCSGHSGYYFHIEPPGQNYLNGHLICCGAYQPLPKQLKSIREEFMLNGDEMLSSIKEAKDFSLEWDNALKTVPKGFPQDSPFSEYFKLKNALLSRRFDNDFLFSKNLLKESISLFKETYHFNTLINRAINYANEEM